MSFKRHDRGVSGHFKILDVSDLEIETGSEMKVGRLEDLSVRLFAVTVHGNRQSPPRCVSAVFIKRNGRGDANPFKILT